MSIDAELVSTSGESRTCTVVLEPSGRATVVNETGPIVDDPGALIAKFDQLVTGARAVALSGSLQPGLPPELYRRLVTRARDADRFCLVDAAGAALVAGLAGRPSVAKPNRAEAEAWAARSLDTEAACIVAASDLCHAGAAMAIITRGSDGVVFHSHESAARCRTTHSGDIRYGNPTGAGDALAAGVIVGHLRGFPPDEMVRLGVAAATASLAEGYGRFRAKDVRTEAVVCERLD